MRAVSGYASLDARCLVKNLSIIRCKRPSRFQFSNLPTYLSVSFAVVLFRACPAAATLRDTSKHESGIAPRCMDVIKIFRARMKSYRSTWFVILVARYRVTIAKLHSLSDPLPSSLQFITRKLPRWFLTLAEQLD